MAAQRVAVIGANGQLGFDLCEEFGRQGDTVLPLTHADLRLEDEASVRAALLGLHPNVILNAGAFHNAPKCEADPLMAYRVNALGARSVALLAEEIGAQNVYFSTDYVFDGGKRLPYLEDDRPNPLNVYANSKLAGEHYTLNECSRGYVARISGIYGRVPCRAKGGNFITTMLRLAREKPEVRVVTDEILTPTPTSEVAKTTRSILLRSGPGLYHLTCEGECSWYEFAKVIFSTMRLSTPLLPVESKDFPAGVRRPLYSVLENARLKRETLPTLPDWNDALLAFLRSQMKP